MRRFLSVSYTHLVSVDETRVFIPASLVSDTYEKDLNKFKDQEIEFIIVFQPELRSALEKVGGQPLKSLRIIGDAHTEPTERMIRTVSVAVGELSRSKTGALIVLERSTRLGDLVLTGTVIDSEPSVYLIQNIFFNKAPLHDGALLPRI